MALLELRGLSKSFPGVLALREIDLDVEAGEVHTLIGENGAGKSTLIKLLSGVYAQDSGVIRFAGKDMTFASPLHAQRAGIYTLYQEFNLLPQLTVAENIYLGAEPRLKYLPFIDWRAMYQQARQVLDMLGVAIHPETHVSELSVAEQQMVELAKTLHAKPRLLIMDEPTSTLSRSEVEVLFGLLQRIKEQGIAVLYVSHRLSEVMEISDRVTVLRDGKRIITVNACDSTVDQLVRLMLGRAVEHRFSRRHSASHAQHETRHEVLRVEHLTRSPAFEDISFSLYTGEIIGLAGLVGSGRTALVRSLFGFEASESGTIYVDGQPVLIQSPHDAVILGMGMLPEDRQQQALLLEMSARENITLAALGERGPLINIQEETNLAEEYIHRLRIKVTSPEAKAKYLSGGTQQKLVLSRWLAVHPRILILDEPTRGIDIGAKLEIYRLLGEIASKSITILLIRSELSEIVGLCDRALVMYSGRLIAELGRDQLTEESLARWVMGDAP
jgi:ribose transport system ATP-binding protein